MTNPKITVGADFSAVEKEAKKLRNQIGEINKVLNSGTVGIDVKQAKRDLASLEQQAQRTAAAMDGASSGKKAASVEQIEDVTKALEEATKAGQSFEQVLDAIGQSSGAGASLKNLHEVAKQTEKVARAQRELAKDGAKYTRDQVREMSDKFDKLKVSGRRGTRHLRDIEFHDWLAGGKDAYSLSDRANKRNAHQIGTAVGMDMRDPDQKSFWSGKAGQNAGRIAGVAGGMITGAMSGGGFGIGSMAGGLAGAIPGAGMVLGPLVGALGGLIDQGLERAISEAGDLSDLRRSLGATSIDFDRLRDEVRRTSDGLGLAYEESAKLAKVFAHTANAREGVGEGSGSAVGFGRGFGLDPMAAVQFFGMMRHYGATTSEKDQKRLAVTIAEAVVRGGVSPKADEALAAIQNYVQASARQSLTKSNIEAYASFMSSLTGLSHYGIKGDPQAAASAMGKANAAISAGGAFGEASKSFSLGIYQRAMPGFSMFDMDRLNEQGAFGTIGRAFGKDSPAYAMAKARGDTGKMDQYDQWATGANADTPLLTMHMKALESFYGSSTDALTKAISSHFGVGASEASALYQAYRSDGGLGKLQAQLDGAGIDMSKLNTKQIAALAEVAGGGPDAVRAQAERLKTGGQLTKEEAAALDEALKKNKPEELEKMVLQLTALHDTTLDEGEEMRNLNAEMKNLVTKVATDLIPAVATMKDAIIRLADKFAPKEDTPWYGSGGDGGGDLPLWQQALNAIGLKGEDGKPYFKGGSSPSSSGSGGGAGGGGGGGWGSGSSSNTPWYGGDPVTSFMTKARRAESSGNDRAKNPGSSASGRYQFTRGTWIGTYRAETGSKESDNAIWAKRWDNGLQDRLMKRLTGDNAEALRKAGLPVNDATLYLAHFAGIDGAIRVLKNPGKSAYSLLGAKAVKANDFLEGMNGADVASWAARKMNGGKGKPKKLSAAGETSDKLPAGGHSTSSPQLAAQDLRIDNRVIVLDRNGREMGNTATQSHARVGAPAPAGTMRA